MPQERYYEDRDRRSDRAPRPPEERERSGGQRRRRRRKKSSAGRTAALVLLYVVAVIGSSILLACVGWVCGMAAEDVLALNKEEKEVTITIAPDTSFDEVVDRLKDEGMIEYKFLFKLFAAFTHGADKVTMGTYTLNTDMDYRALLAGMQSNSRISLWGTTTVWRAT